MRSVCYLLILAGFCSCSPSKYLTDDQSFLKKNEITFEDPENAINKSDLKVELAQFFEQTPNGKFMYFWPREYYYFKHSDPGDTSWYNNWVREDIGEPPAIYEEQYTQKTADNMHKFLKNIKGYFEANVDYNVTTISKHTKVDYRVNLGQRYKINSIKYLSKNKEVLKLIEELQKESLLQEGSYIDANIFNDERNKITSYLQNNGYANFLSNYIDVKADSTKTNFGFDFYLEILDPPGETKHQKFNIGDINVYTDFHTNQDTTALEEELLFNKNFFRESEKFIIKPSALDEMIFMNPGQLYNREDRYKTIRKLSGLGTYKFVNVSPFIIEGKDSIINYNIALSPFRNKWVLDYGTDIFYSTINASGRKLIGLSIGGSLQNRNAFGGAEKNSLSTELGVEFELSSPVRVNTLTLRLQDNIEIPRYVSLFSALSLYNKLGLIKDKDYQHLEEETSTLIGGGYSFQRVLDWYDISSFNISYGYSYQPNKTLKVDFKQIGFNLNDYDLKAQFPSDNPGLLLSFQPSLFTGVLFRELSYFRKWKTGSFDKNAYTFLASFEVSGLEIYGANKLYNAISSSSKIWKVSNNLDFSNFFRLQLDGRYYRNVTQGSAIAARTYLGIVVPYADDKVNPYVKQLYVGGPNSIRAWQSRELGPGNFSDLLINPIQDQLFYQAGDIKLEFNLEYRFDMFWLLEGAFFIDGGNVWTLRSDSEREGSKISSNFYEQIAIGAGWGLRWDFSYFIIRADFGYKIRNPYAIPGPVSKSPWVFDFNGFGNANIAVNYPF